MKTTEAVVPFRWDVAKVAELGRWLNGCDSVERRQRRPAITMEALHNLFHQGGATELVDCTARIVAQAGDADVVFVGRSLESVYELLRGAFWGTEQQTRWCQLLVSLRGDSDLAIGAWSRIAPLVPYLRSLGLEPRQLVRRRRALVFADLVSTGGTFEMLIALLRRIASEQGADWNVIRRVLNIVAVVGHYDGRDWREVAQRLRRNGVRNISSVRVTGRLWECFAVNTIALAQSHPEWRWSDPRAATAIHDRGTARNVRSGYVLHWTARTRLFRERLMRAIARQAPQHSPYLSSLMHTLRCTHVSVCGTAQRFATLIHPPQSPHGDGRTPGSRPRSCRSTTSRPRSHTS